MNTPISVFQSDNRRWLTYGKYSSIALTLITFVTFALAMIAIPISGSNAPANSGFSFPYTNTFAQYPRDFLWQYSALAQLIVYLFFMATLRQNTRPESLFPANLANTFAAISVAILALTYYTQVMVVPASLKMAETDGLALLIQYNPHGLFIALEELGYLFMSLSLGSLIPLAGGKNKRFRAIKIVLAVSVSLTFLSLLVVSAFFGIDKQDRLEVAIISINWITLMVIGGLFFRIYRGEETLHQKLRPDY